MTNIKAVDVSEIEKLKKIRLYEPIPESLFQTREVPYVKLADVLALLDRSPSVSAPTIPEGYALVPIEPTAEMRHAFRVKQIDCPNSPRVLYKAMLSAYKPEAIDKARE